MYGTNLFVQNQFQEVEQKIQKIILLWSNIECIEVVSLYFGNNCAKFGVPYLCIKNIEVC